MYRPAPTQHPSYCFWAARPPGTTRTSPDPAWPRRPKTINLHRLRSSSGAQLNRRGAMDAEVLATLCSAIIAPLRFHSPPGLFAAWPRGEACGLTPKSETRSPQPAPPASCVFGNAPHSEAARPPRFRAPLSYRGDAVGDFGLRISAFFRPSTFGLRTSP